MNLYGQKPDSRFLFGDIEYFGDEIDIHDFESGNRPAGLDQALVRFHKQAAGKIIQNVVDVPTDSDYHGDGKAFMILDDGNMYVTTSKAGHGKIMSYLSDQMEFQGNRF